MSGEVRKCPKCRGSGEQLDQDKAVMALLSFGMSMLADAADDDAVLTKRCKRCLGTGYVKIRAVR